jgi:hypothetical protein
MSIPDRLYLLYMGPYARETKASFMEESGEDPLEISPSGLGVGIGQQSAAWQVTYPPSMPPLNGLLYGHAMATDRRWHPAFQLGCRATFCHRHSMLDMGARLRAYHYGHEQNSDPDGYVAKVMLWYDKLVNWAKG